MNTYCYSLTLDGAEMSMQSAPFDTDEEAIAHGRVALLDAVRLSNPKTAYCAVFESAGTDAEPMGAWDYSREEPTPRWSADE